MSKIIFFSGACNSGKSSAIKLIATALKSKGYQVKTLEESFIPADTSIDDLRKDVNKYLEAQEAYILNRIAREKKIASSSENTIWLVNRALTDTLAYYLFYVNKTELTDNSAHKYVKLYTTIVEHLYGYNLPNFYCLHFTSGSLDIDLSKKSRPKNLKDLQVIEDSLIIDLNRMYFPKNIMRFVSYRQFYADIRSIIGYLKKYFLCDTQK